ncbi:MAG: hypothetical protein LBC09_07375 [Helicobacteraceae bacterium]|jgi:hypothetical protein|nr:hypothetical protein [Helicobacteraceae bacterium]
MNLDNAQEVYRRARLAYALQELRKEMRLYEKSIERRLNRAKTDEELRALLEAIGILRETRRFYRETVFPSKPSLDFVALLDYRR